MNIGKERERERERLLPTLSKKEHPAFSGERRCPKMQKKDKKVENWKYKMARIQFFS